MPYVNGNFHRSAGQGYAAEKSKMGDNQAASPEPESSEGNSKGSILHIKHHGGGKISIKHEDGEVTKHEGMDDATEHMKEHFGLHDAEGKAPEDEASEYEMGDGGEALKSILG